MLLYPNAKINLGLNVLFKREDGFHEIESCFLPVSWKDALEIVPNKVASFSVSGIEIPDDGTENLCMKAFRLLQEEYDIPNARLHLHKNIPIGAGLGGGSADAAFALNALNKLFSLGLTDEQLEKHAKKLGSDCAFFIKNKAVFCKGKGDEFETLNLDPGIFKGKKLLLIYPDIHVSTATAYAGLGPAMPETNIKDVLVLPMEEWQGLLVNDFEKSVFQKHPEIAALKTDLYKNGAVYASMSGSGSSVYAFFDDGIEEQGLLKKLKLPKAYSYRFVDVIQ